jgi:hypothetical protein
MFTIGVAFEAFFQSKGLSTVCLRALKWSRVSPAMDSLPVSVGGTYEL